MRLRLPASLLDLVPPAERPPGPGSQPLTLSASTWPEAVKELRARFPRLAARSLTETGAVASGFFLVANDRVVPPGQEAVEVGAQDELSLVPLIAGGRAPLTRG